MWTRSSFLERGGLWVLGQSALMIAVMALGVMLRSGSIRPAAVVSGVVLLVLGAFFGLAGVAALKTSLTSFPKPRDDAQLVQDGIYSLVRHPLYTSIVLISLGWALAWQSWAAFIAALAMIPFFEAKARREENWLRQRFPEYARYEQRVCRFLPWIY